MFERNDDAHNDLKITSKIHIRIYPSTITMGAFWVATGCSSTSAENDNKMKRNEQDAFVGCHRGNEKPIDLKLENWATKARASDCKELVAVFSLRQLGWQHLCGSLADCRWSRCAGDVARFVW